MKHGNVAAFDQRLFDFEALGGLDVFQVDTAPGIGDACHGIDERLRILGIHFDVHRVDAREALEQHALAFHHRLAGQRPQIPQAQNGTAV